MWCATIRAASTRGAQSMRSDLVAREVLTVLRRNVPDNREVLTRRLGGSGPRPGLLAVRTIDRTAELYSDRVEVQSLSRRPSSHRPAWTSRICARPSLEVGRFAGSSRSGS